MPNATLRPILGSILRSVWDVGIGGGGSAWTPAALFAKYGATGGVWDFTDSSLLFQNSGGTGAVALSDPIGYVSDIGPAVRPGTQATAGNRPVWSGMPRTLGSELVTNGRFASDTAWTKGAGWTIAAGVATKAAGTASVLSQTVSLTAGKSYFISFNITRTAGTVLARFTGGTTVSGVSRNTAGSYVDTLIAVTGNTAIEFSADAAFAGTVDNVTVKEVTAFTNMGALFDGVDDRLQTAAINLSGTQTCTVVVSSYYANPTGGNSNSVEFGNYYGNVTGSFALNHGSPFSPRLRGDAAQAQSTLPNAEALAGVPVLNVNSAQFDISQGTILTEIIARARGVQPTNTAGGTTAGGGNMANGAVTLGAAANSFFYWQGFEHRVAIINAILSPADLVLLERWSREGMAYVGTLGDSTVGLLNAGVGLPNAYPVSTLVGGAVAGAANLAFAGNRIAQQKTAWTGLATKSALEAVFIQVGLNDIRSRIGAGTATTADIITELQDLVNTVNADKPAGCKTYICGLTPCKLWLDGAAFPAAAYTGWLDVNTAISGGGATPITGVDARITSHVAALNDGSGNLQAIYDFNNDGVHESNEARFIIAQAWRTQLEADGLV